MAESATSRHRQILESVRPTAAAASLRKTETRNLRREIGQCIAAARSIVGWTQDQLAGEIAVVLKRERFDPAQVARWEAGNERERPPFDVLFAIEPLFWPLITQLAKLDASVETVTEIRRRA